MRDVATWHGPGCSAARNAATRRGQKACQWGATRPELRENKFHLWAKKLLDRDRTDRYVRIMAGAIPPGRKRKGTTMSERLKVCDKQYLGADGAKSKITDATRARFHFSNGHDLDVDPGEYPATVQRALMFHGLHQKIGDTFAGAAKALEKGDTTDPVQWAIDEATAVHETLAGGDWGAERVAGEPPITMLVEAARRWAERDGKRFDEAKAREKLKDAAYAKAFRAGPVVAAILASIRAERAAARATELAEKASAADATFRM